MRVEIKVLNQVSVELDGKRVRLGDQKQRNLLGILAIELRPVSKDALARLLWEEGLLWGEKEEKRLKNPEGQLHSYVSRLRQAMDAVVSGSGETLLRTRRGLGYCLHAAEDDIDYHRFRRLARSAVSAATPAEGARLGRLALAQWGETSGTRGGYPLGTTDLLLESYTEKMRQEYQAALMTCLQAELDCGRHRQILPELNGLAQDAAGRDNEELARMRMLAYYRSGLPQQALAVYQDLYQVAAGYGHDLNPKTKELQQMILNQDPALNLPEETTVQQNENPAEQVATPPAAPEDQPRSRFNFNNHVFGDDARFQQAETIYNYEGTAEP